MAANAKVEILDDERLAQAAAETVRRIHETSLSLQGAGGPKALVRRFGDLLRQGFGARHLDCARLVGRGPKLTLRRRVLRADDLEVFGDETLAALEALLRQARWEGSALPDFQGGPTDLTLGGLEVTIALMDDPRASAGSVVLWDRQAAPGVLDRALLDGLVRTLQNEGRWLRRLDRTQAMLYQDDLTGLYNYRYFELALQAELRRSERFQSQFCLLFIDLDGFKPINDTHGHMSGSSVLKQVAEVLRDAVREVDVPIRYGGDEFIVVLLGATCAKGVLAAERVRRKIEAREFRVDDGRTTRLTASIGVAAFPDHGRDLETLLKMADETMYDSKKAGKNRVSVVTRPQQL